jgi:hypothetical protein
VLLARRARPVPQGAVAGRVAMAGVARLLLSAGAAIACGRGDTAIVDDATVACVIEGKPIRACSKPARNGMHRSTVAMALTGSGKTGWRRSSPTNSG